MKRVVFGSLVAISLVLACERPASRPLAGNATGNRASAALPAIGMIAPEIEGKDLDGVSFKLSDYRGKVVVLDFWGNW